MQTGNALDREKLAGIDATRGWAIMLVMLVHSLGVFANLPWPVARIGLFGWYGVQMFFVASALTLLLSWHRQKAPLSTKIAAFFVRRFFRIAPMYYVAAAAYVFLRPPEAFDPGQFLFTLAFLNGWSPDWMGVPDGAWQVVPGGWSISVEFSFYVVFPILALHITTLSRSLAFAAMSFLIMMVCQSLGTTWLAPQATGQTVERFLYFWFPNQLIVFSIGFVVFHVIAGSNPASRAIRASFHSNGQRYLGLACVLFLCLTQVGTSKTVSGGFPWLPTHLLVSILFAIAILSALLGEFPSRLYSNRFIQSLGEVSFSAYLVHWAVIDLIRHAGNIGLFDPTVGGMMAIVWFLPTYAFVVMLTFSISKITYRVVERPFIALSKTLFRPQLVASQ